MHAMLTAIAVNVNKLMAELARTLWTEMKIEDEIIMNAINQKPTWLLQYDPDHFIPVL